MMCAITLTVHPLPMALYAFVLDTTEKSYHSGMVWSLAHSLTVSFLIS